MDKVVGTKQVLKAIVLDKAEMVYIALDTDAFLKSKLENACIEANIPVSWIPTMKQLGEMCGITVGSATAAQLKNDLIS